MSKTYLWQAIDFPHFYYNPAVVEPLEFALKRAIKDLDKKLKKQNPGTENVFTEEIIANSEIEGVLLDRKSIHSSFIQNILPSQEKEQGAVALIKLAMERYDQPLSHELLYEMHREVMKGYTGFPSESIGSYVGDMKIVSGTRMDREYKVIHRGVSKKLAHEKMTEFINWYNQRSTKTSLVNAIQGHIHFETLHPFCDGNGRIGRTLMLMGLCRDFKLSSPIALSRSFNKNLNDYYLQFETGLDITEKIQRMSPLLGEAVRETMHILELTAYRKKISDQGDQLSDRQLKVLNRLINYELRGGFEGGMNNTKYQKMTGIGDRTALRDLNDLESRELIVKTGKLKGTRYYLNVPYLVERLSNVHSSVRL